MLRVPDCLLTVEACRYAYSHHWRMHWSRSSEDSVAEEREAHYGKLYTQLSPPVNITTRTFLPPSPSFLWNLEVYFSRHRSHVMVREVRRSTLGHKRGLGVKLHTQCRPIMM
ncbi:hypothetical protein CC1G_01474 [Coprinopsis cinerea okayama7|uniref:Uncharacterized protein n=1 Tax=Coprinopsis cinerea (strain Okayama-7 / 130 / ATCC MYA-4618 / FGSC 9003) TaxID=240176 RepID=A8NYY9_COPC7|nr:hypothetical protein CC1G_01474 [Coprinopsis cinerea okayama7\|eukprot:XP_001837562.2 hypothetical protein CC1G_01474 [Coprinopsis cinerea okayama7\